MASGISVFYSPSDSGRGLENSEAVIVKLVTALISETTPKILTFDSLVDSVLPLERYYDEKSQK